MALRRDRALILRKTPYGESSLVVQVLTRHHGRVHLLAKGAYRSTSRYFCVLDFLDELSFEWSHSEGRELQTLRSAGLEDRRRVIRTDVARYRAANALLELVELAARPSQVDEDLYDLTNRALGALEDEHAAAELVLVAFELRFLQVLGLAPALTVCASCATEHPTRVERAGAPRVAFSAGAGGRLCLDCAREAKSSGRRVGTLPEKLIHDAERVRAGARDAQLSEDERADVRRFVERFMDYHLETRPKSRRHAMRRGALR